MSPEITPAEELERQKQAELAEITKELRGGASPWKSLANNIRPDYPDDRIADYVYGLRTAIDGWLQQRGLAEGQIPQGMRAIYETDLSKAMANRLIGLSRSLEADARPTDLITLQQSYLTRKFEGQSFESTPLVHFFEEDYDDAHREATGSDQNGEIPPKKKTISIGRK